ncbi:MAG: NAD-dependent epimerase/dehydratase family protein [Litoreibacter sp.]
MILGANGRVGRLLLGIPNVIPLRQARTDADICFDIMMDSAALRAAISQVDVILNLAGATHHSETPLAGRNVRLARQVLDHADGKQVFLISSAAVYGAQSGELFETSALRSNNDYGREKIAMEEMACAHPAKSTVLRLGNVLGADALLGMGRTTFALDTFTDGTTPERSYIGPRLLGCVLGKLMNTEVQPPILNVATSAPVSMADLLMAAGHSWTATRAPKTAIKTVSLNTDLLQSIISIPPTASTASSLVSDLQSVREPT